MKNEKILLLLTSVDINDQIIGWKMLKLLEYKEVMELFRHMFVIIYKTGKFTFLDHMGRWGRLYDNYVVQDDLAAKVQSYSLNLRRNIKFHKKNVNAAYFDFYKIKVFELPKHIPRDYEIVFNETEKPNELENIIHIILETLEEYVN